MSSPDGQPLGVGKSGVVPPSAGRCLPASPLRRKLPAGSGCVVVAPSLRAGFNGTSRRGNHPASPFVSLTRHLLLRSFQFGNEGIVNLRLHFIRAAGGGGPDEIAGFGLGEFPAFW